MTDYVSFITVVWKFDMVFTVSFFISWLFNPFPPLLAQIKISNSSNFLSFRVFLHFFSHFTRLSSFCTDQPIEIKFCESLWI